MTSWLCKSVTGSWVRLPLVSVQPEVWACHPALLLYSSSPLRPQATNNTQVGERVARPFPIEMVHSLPVTALKAWGWGEQAPYIMQHLPVDSLFRCGRHLSSNPEQSRVRAITPGPHWPSCPPPPPNHNGLLHWGFTGSEILQLGGNGSC